MKKNDSMKLSQVIKTDKFANFCGGCNNQTVMHNFIQIDEGQSLEDAWGKRNENISDDIFKRNRFMSFCLCGNVWLM